MYVWGVNSTVTKHWDYFVWKDTSERVTRRCDGTVDKKRVNSCVLKYLFWRELSNQKNRQKSRTCFPRRATNVMFSKICGWRRSKKPGFRHVIRISQEFWVESPRQHWISHNLLNMPRFQNLPRDSGHAVLPGTSLRNRVIDITWAIPCFRFNVGTHFSYELYFHFTTRPRIE